MNARILLVCLSSLSLFACALDTGAPVEEFPAVAATSMSAPVAHHLDVELAEERSAASADAGDASLTDYDPNLVGQKPLITAPQ